MPFSPREWDCAALAAAISTSMHTQREEAMAYASDDVAALVLGADGLARQFAHQGSSMALDREEEQLLAAYADSPSGTGIDGTPRGADRASARAGRCGSWAAPSAGYRNNCGAGRRRWTPWGRPLRSPGLLSRLMCG